MTIKSDKWIKKMAQEHQLIEPFTENQVRDADSGNKIISYGVSSFGYDAVSYTHLTLPTKRIV